MDISADLQLYASHRDFLEKVALLHKANWYVSNIFSYSNQKIYIYIYEYISKLFNLEGN